MEEELKMFGGKISSEREVEQTNFSPPSARAAWRRMLEGQATGCWGQRRRGMIGYRIHNYLNVRHRETLIRSKAMIVYLCFVPAVDDTVIVLTES